MEEYKQDNSVLLYSAGWTCLCCCASSLLLINGSKCVNLLEKSKFSSIFKITIIRFSKVSWWSSPGLPNKSYKLTYSSAIRWYTLQITVLRLT